jgi:hypothetical protein
MSEQPLADAHDVFLVFVDGREGQQDTYAGWFASTHLDDMLHLPGVISAKACQLEGLCGEPAPARLCAIYETDDGPAILHTIASAKGTSALPVSDMQGAMTWRVLEGVRARRFVNPPRTARELICMFGGAWDTAAEQSVWDKVCADPEGILALRQTRLSPAQPSRGSEYSEIWFLTIADSCDPERLVQAIGAAKAASTSRFLLARPFGERP